MTWSHWQVPPFITGVFFILGVLTLYWVSYNWLVSWAHVRRVKVKDDVINTWYGVIYMLVFVFSIQALLIGQNNAWQFMNFQLIAIIFCAYFLNIHVSYFFFFPIVLVYMIFDGSLVYWQSWAHAITLMIFFTLLNLIRINCHGRRWNLAMYLGVALPFGALLWFWMKLKYNFSWATYWHEWLYLVIFEILLYVYVSMLAHDSELKLRLAQFASHDALTQTGNFAAYTAAIKEYFEDSQLNRQPLTMMMFDVDHFKAINDTYGHSTGDVVLREVAATVQTVLSANDGNIEFFRTGGEEFNLLFPGYTAAETAVVVNQIFQAVNHLEVHTAGTVIQVSLSVGVSAVVAEDQSPMDLFNRVDRNMYHSKRNGRMRVTIA
ncbi:GGDEF domain-containing protein [Levilactobacillus tangyuanensis]|uniref:GGDEF domain-containing protein n=1 Tax=Levilactobacillus tangyuanensis TaxID=2486021 RepID=A0ABW1TQQ5_9LACO|nr:GGDEF domain-containing protein [Levilactobacillus tangyuanensis]